MENNNVDINKINAQIKKDSEFIDLLLIEINKVIVGQKYMLERLLIGLLGKGHILLEEYDLYQAVQLITFQACIFVQLLLY